MRIAEEIGRWDRGNGFAAIRAGWLTRAIGVGEPIRVNLADRAIDGRFESLDEAGRLVLVGANGRRQIVGAGDVFLTRAG